MPRTTADADRDRARRALVRCQTKLAEYHMGLCTHDDLRAAAVEARDLYNAHARKVAAELGVRPRLLALASLMR